MSDFEKAREGFFADKWYAPSMTVKQFRSSEEPRVVMAPAQIEKMPVGWSMMRLLDMFAAQDLSRVGDGADKLLIRMQLYLLKDANVSTEVFPEVFDFLTECRFQVEESRRLA